jgi:hypothetical protein
MNWWTGGMTGERKGRQFISVLLSQDAQPCINVIDYCALLNELHCLLSYRAIVHEPHCLWSCY